MFALVWQEEIRAAGRLPELIEQQDQDRAAAPAAADAELDDLVHGAAAAAAAARGKAAAAAAGAGGGLGAGAGVRPAAAAIAAQDARIKEKKLRKKFKNVYGVGKSQRHATFSASAKPPLRSQPCRALRFLF